jgi:beta-1,4-mannosyl-glycoprotein beta-1,4-N-acetylglucosaminyltransferase
MRGLTDCKKDDIILISDVDEIPAGADIPLLVNRLLKCKNPLIFCGQKTYRYFLNRWDGSNIPWAGTAIMTYDFLKKHFPQYTRRRKDWKDFPLIESGWHLTTMGGNKKVIEKFQSVVLHHGDNQEFLINKDRINKAVAEHVLVKIDETFPRFVQNNRDYLTQNGFIENSETK